MGEAQKKLAELDSALTALAHESRRHILLVVWFRGGAMTAGEIAARFGCTWPTTSRHLRVLEAAGLLEVERQGRTRSYRVNIRKLQLVQEWLNWFEGPKNKGATAGARKGPRLPAIKNVAQRSRKK
jgi:DNA-binding transcriptional ArsR family regulator